MRSVRLALSALLGIGLNLVSNKAADVEKESVIRHGNDSAAPGVFARPAPGPARGYRTLMGEGDSRLPVVLVRGTPYEMGRQLGELMAEPIRAFVPAAVAGILAEMKIPEETAREVWARTAAYADDRVEQELAGLADGCGLPLGLLQAMHAVPLLMPYSCSSIAAWGAATEDGHLYQTRNLDWKIGRAHV